MFLFPHQTFSQSVLRILILDISLAIFFPQSFSTVILLKLICTAVNHNNFFSSYQHVLDNFHIRTVHLDIINILFIHQLMH